MRHLRLFNESEVTDQLKLYFNDKIDWKFISYIDDVLTEYEDMGAIISLFVDVISSRVPPYTYNYGHVWSSVEKFDMQVIDQQRLGKLIACYEESGLVYSLGFPKEYNGITLDIDNIMKKLCLRSELYADDSTPRYHILRLKTLQ